MEVELIAYTPYPDGVANLGAGVCVSDHIPGLETSANGKRALKHALDSGHESVAEHAVFTFMVSGVSRALTHQLVRHRVASYSQQSQRYVKMDGFGYITPKSILESDATLKSLDPITIQPVTYTLKDEYDAIIKNAFNAYKRLIEKYGIPAEDARYVLPNACTTNIMVTMNARELRHFFAVRCCRRAQWEIRELADRMLELVQNVAPVLFEDAGAQCVQLGYCPESKGCGRAPKLDDLKRAYEADQKDVS